MDKKYMNILFATLLKKCHIKYCRQKSNGYTTKFLTPKSTWTVVNILVNQFSTSNQNITIRTIPVNYDYFSWPMNKYFSLPRENFLDGPVITFQAWWSWKDILVWVRLWPKPVILNCRASPLLSIRRICRRTVSITDDPRQARRVRSRPGAWVTESGTTSSNNKFG